jgi:hypothetical protein
MTSKSIEQMVDISLHFCIQKHSQILKAYVPRGANILRTELVSVSNVIACSSTYYSIVYLYAFLNLEIGRGDIFSGPREPKVVRSLFIGAYLLCSILL